MSEFDLETIQRITELTEWCRKAEAERDAARAAKTKAEEAELAAAQELDEVKAERDALEQSYHLLANEMVYEGNSVQHWHQKARAYKECARAIYELKQLTGVETPAAVVVAVQALAAHVDLARYKFIEMVSRTGPHGDPMIEREKLREFDGFIRRRPVDTTTSLARLIAEKQRAAYLAGWMASGEGCNGEYPGYAYRDPEWLAEREEWIRRQAEGDANETHDL